MKWVSCRPHIYGSYFCINAASLCVLVGAFNPFTFKVIINMSDPIIILLIVLSLFFVRSFLSLVFPAQRTSFSICCKAGLVVLDSLNFCLSGKLLISLSHLNESLIRQSSLGWMQVLFFPHFKYIALFPLACRVSVEKLADKPMGVPSYVRLNN